MSSQEQPSQVPTIEPIITTSFPPLYETTIPHTTSSMPHDSPLSGGDTPGSDEGSKKLNELTELYTKLSDKVTSLEEDLKQTKKVYGKALTKLVKKVKYLEDKIKSTSVRRKARMVIFDDEEDLVSEDPSKHRRMTETEYEDVDVETEYEEVEYELDQTDTFHAAKILADASRERVKTYKSYTRKRRSTVSSRDSTAGELQKQLDEREETDNIDWSIMAEQVQKRQSDTIKRYQTLKKKPVSVAQARKNMMIYLKNMAGYKMGYFKGMNYDEVRPMFEKEYNKIQTLFKKDTEVEKTKRVAEETLLQESFKKLRTSEASRSEPIQEQPTEDPKELSKEELKKMLEIVPVEEIKAEALQVKRQKATRSVGSSSKVKNVESKTSNFKEPKQSWGSTISDVPSSSLNDCRNDHIAKIMGYGDYQIRNVIISRVYYVEGLGHNLFSVGPFCDSDLKVTFCKHAYFIHDLDGVDLHKGSRGSNLYTLSMDNLLLSSPICLLSKASKTKSWLWHRRLSHLNFDYINSLAKHGLVRGLPKLKYQKDHLCSTCALGKSKKHSHKPKAEDSIQEKLYLLHMDLCGPMRVQRINGRKYILVIVDDFSRFTWVKFLRSKDEVSEFVIEFLKMIQVRLNATVRNIKTDNGTEFVNQTLRDYYEEVGISHQTSVARTP
ncbi:retrovirus-related pol polyprotein from transposon TNT 1-94 [Tanacetum coccineum]